jgi:carboxylesterase type B
MYIKIKYLHKTLKSKFFVSSVMVFIHGGGFSSGSGSANSYGAERFLDFGVVRIYNYNYNSI